MELETEYEKIQGRLYPVDGDTKMEKQPDAIRCQHPETIGPFTQRCRIVKIENGMVDVHIGIRHCLIPIQEVQIIRKDVEGTGLHDEKPL